VFLFGQMEKDIKDNGITENSMELEIIIIQMENIKKDNGIKASE